MAGYARWPRSGAGLGPARPVPPRTPTVSHRDGSRKVRGRTLDRTTRRGRRQCAYARDRLGRRREFDARSRGLASCPTWRSLDRGRGVASARAEARAGGPGASGRAGWSIRGAARSRVGRHRAARFAPRALGASLNATRNPCPRPHLPRHRRGRVFHSRPMTRSVALVADSGASIGMGHTGRCIALGQAFVALGWRVVLVASEPSARRFARANGIPTARVLRGRWDLAILDTYRGPRRAATTLHRIATRVVAIDDLHQFRASDVDVIVRPSAGERASRGVLAGAGFILLRREYWSSPRSRRVGRRRVLVALGAYPSASDVARIRAALRSAHPAARVIAASGVRRGQLGSLARRLARADLAIVSGGQTMNESLAVGLPTIVVTTFANQRRQVNAAAAAGAIIPVGTPSSPLFSSRLERAVARALRPAVRRGLVRAARQLVDGRGALRLARALALVGDDVPANAPRGRAGTLRREGRSRRNPTVASSRGALRGSADAGMRGSHPHTPRGRRSSSRSSR